MRAQNRPSQKLINKIEPENNPESKQKFRSGALRMMAPQFEFNDERDEPEVPFAYKATVPIIAYPLLAEGNKRRKFKKKGEKRKL